jgi:KDO2-lipid IV(A) lauroyltransferase
MPSFPRLGRSAGAVFTRAALGMLWLVAWLPWPWQRRLAAAAGAFAFHCVPIRRHVTLVNLRVCFPGLTETARRKLARRHYQSLALGVLEVARCWWRRPADLPACRIEGLEGLEQAKAAGRSVLLVSAHFTTLEIAGRLLSLRTPICCLYRDPNNPVLAALFRRHRGAWMRQAIEMRDLNGLLRALRGGETVWYAADQGKWTPQSAVLPFFGRPAITNTSTSRLAKMSGAAVFTFFPRREADGTYVLTISPELTEMPGPDPEADTLRLTALLEEAVRRSPEQYLWVHRRFKGFEGNPVSPY